MRIKKGDMVKMISGKDSGKTGKVLNVFVDRKKLTVEGLNLLKKHQKPRREGEKGQRIEVPRAVDISNAMFLCPKCGKATRVGYKLQNDNKFRTCKKCGAEV